MEWETEASSTGQIIICSQCLDRCLICADAARWSLVTTLAHNFWAGRLNFGIGLCSWCCLQPFLLTQNQRCGYRTIAILLLKRLLVQAFMVLLWWSGAHELPLEVSIHRLTLQPWYFHARQGWGGRGQNYEPQDFLLPRVDSLQSPSRRSHWKLILLLRAGSVLWLGKECCLNFWEGFLSCRHCLYHVLLDWLLWGRCIWRKHRGKHPGKQPRL